ncbi:methyl-accepting chemotaxis sensory transducer with Cache sensor [Anoxybacillus vitaminiphilus]|uniref:Methyl-accepting chemotaxis sensory transducer with Cache sensor n=1 Tax=Paranoxybacillus vitaminiphilus TaxID=581036 RepID=A0A327YEK1_9BACL|nr:methyl-accepting chemotaxis protein [Anoxybacillus vitaminiphilus]RAK18941.1 methyl-accepting chemotaxis sensory transducer with Cache sensor [Anoxybacillus vitaminiphilus]
MGKGGSLIHKISFQLIALAALLMVTVTAVLGEVSYSFAKRELIESGKLDLQHIVGNAVTMLEHLDSQVKSGELTLEEAQEKARTLLNGPKLDEHKNMFYDYKQTSFVYKENGYVFAFDSNYKVQLHPLQPLGADFSKMKNSQDQFVIRDLVKISKSSSPSERFYEYLWKNKGESKEREKIAYVVYFDAWDWMVGVGAYKDEFYESLKILKYVTIAITAVVSILGLSVFYFLIRRKIKVLEKLQHVSAVVAAGNLAVEPISYKTKNEIGKLTDAFNTMIQNLQMLVGNIKEMGMKVSKASAELSALSEETAATSDEINRAVQEIVNVNSSQAAEIEKLSNQTDSLASSVDNLSKQNKLILDLTEHAATAVENGKEQVSVLQRANQASIKSSNEISIGITNLYTKVKEISNIVTTIEQIATQTNLLALNASIEAARAGEHGKGFAVVAEEVRKLAEATNLSTGEIQQMIEGIERETEATVTTMSQTISISDELNKAVQDTEKEFAQISSAIANIINAIRTSSKDIDVIHQGMRNFIEATATISSVAQQTSASSEEIMASVDEQGNAVQTITHSAVQLNELSEQLNQLVSKFQLKD